METLAEAAGWLFGWLLRNSAHASLLALVVLGLERAVGRRLAPRWRYGLWLVVVARLVLPVAPESHLSLFNLVDFAPASLAGAALQVLGLPAPVALPALEPTHPLADTPSWFVWALAIWFPGAIVLAAIVWRDHRRLDQALATTSPILDSAVVDLLSQSRAVMGVHRRIAIVETPCITSPAISGCWRPRLLLPTGLLARLSTDETRFLFLHELAHVKRADLILNWILATLQILHWFNPVIWLALRRLISVREEVCDDLVLRRCFPGAGREYGLTLLRILEECAPRRVMPSLAGILDDVGALRQRIRSIRDFPLSDPNPWVPAGLTIAVAIAGLTERVAQPLLWPTLKPRGIQIASLTPVSPEAHALALHEAPPSESAGAEPGDAAPRRAGTAARIFQTFAAALHRAVGETAAGRARRSSVGDSANAAASTPQDLRPAPPRPVPTLRVVPVNPVPSAPARPAGNPLYPLPPIGQRGNILQPPKGPSEVSLAAPPVTLMREATPAPGRSSAASRPSVQAHGG